MKQTIFLLVLAMVMCSLNVCAQTKKPARKTTVSVPKDSKEYQIEEDGFEWYKVCKNGKFGAENRNGTVLIPLEYDYTQSRGQVIDLHNPLTRTKITGDGSFVITAR